MKRISLASLVLSSLALIVVSIAFAASTSSSATVVIHHQLKGCHSWSVNGDAFAPSQSVTLAKGGSVTFTNNDVMAHKLVQVSGAPVKIPAANMNHMGAKTTVVFSKAGTYTFKTIEGQDYMAGVKTVGPDNILKLKVTVS